jgi:large subunit ribosomal protein L15
MKLNELRDNPGARRPKKRLGRGIGSGLGKTSGRGHKGAKARSGSSPKRGFVNVFRKNYVELNLGKLQRAIDEKRLDAERPIDAEALVAARVLRRARDGVRLLAKGELKSRIAITVAGASKAAVDAVEKLGGSVTQTAPKPAAPEQAPTAGAA